MVTAEVREKYHLSSLSLVSRLGPEDQVGLERRTRGQGRNCDWVRERRERLTASNFGR